MTSKASQVDQDLIRAIAELLNEQNLAEIEIERDDFRVRVTRSLASNVVHAAPQVYAAPAPAAVSHAPPAGPSAAVAAAAATPAAEDLASNPGTLTSPMVGTAYSAP